MEYLYGMKYRGFSMGCQPMSGLIERMDDKTGKYWDILKYSRQLSPEEVASYELEFIGLQERFIVDSESFSVL